MATAPSTTGTSPNVFLDALQWGGWYWHDSMMPAGPVVVSYYLAGSWSSSEANSFASAIKTWANVANIVFERVDNSASAQLVEHKTTNSVLPGTLGEHGTPDSAASSGGDYDGDVLLGIGGRAHGWFNTSYWSPGGLSRGGYDYLTFVHELGHALGLAHPFDHGGGSGVFPGVTSGDSGDTGTNRFNQGLYTVMAYNDGWYTQQNPYGHGLTRYGYEAGPMAFDIAAIQFLYGTNASYHAGDNVYALPTGNGTGTYWYCIWDTGGNDTISVGGSRNVTIDLRAATLDLTATGGGMPSYAHGIYGGVTIAHGVVIENARSGSGNDRLTGNDADNRLAGSSGRDTLIGGQGDDTLAGGSGNDNLYGGLELDDGDWVSYAGTYAVRVDLAVTARQSTGGGGRDLLSDIENVTGSSSDDVLFGTSDANRLIGGNGRDKLVGRGGDDTLSGGNHGDTLDGGAGSDEVTGGGGADTFRFTSLVLGEHDTITDFQQGIDKLALLIGVFSAFTARGAVAASTFASGAISVAQDADDHLIYNVATGNLYYDADGNGGIQPAIEIASLTPLLSLAASDFVVF